MGLFSFIFDILTGTGSSPEHSYTGRKQVEQFDPTRQPNELMPSTWYNGGYVWDRQTRQWMPEKLYEAVMRDRETKGG